MQRAMIFRCPKNASKNFSRKFCAMTNTKSAHIFLVGALFFLHVFYKGKKVHRPTLATDGGGIPRARQRRGKPLRRREPFGSGGKSDSLLRAIKPKTVLCK